MLLLRPAYAMYRFYAEVAGAKVREIAYDGAELDFPLEAMLEAITPQTRAVLIANPNNPTGTGLSLLAIERILKRAAQGRGPHRRSLLRILRHHRAGPHRATRRTCSSAALFRKCTAWRPCGSAACSRIPPTSRILHKAQSPYSVNTLAVLAAQAAIQDTAYIENYVAEVLAARELLVVGLERLGIPYVPSSANFVLFRAGERAIEIRDDLRDQGILVRDRSYEAPGCVRITVGTREQTRRLLAALEDNMAEAVNRLRHGRRAGGRHRFLSRNHRAHSRTFHRRHSNATRRSRTTRTRAVSTTIGSCRIT